MDANLKKALRAISLELRHTLEGTYDERGDFQPGDLEQRLNAIGVWRDRAAKPLTELTHLPAADKAARQTIDAYLHFRAEAGVAQAEAVAEFVREAAYNWANRLLTLRCMEARGIIDEVVLQKEVYGWRSMVHNRLGQRDPALLAQPDEGLFTVLLAEFGERARELPALFNPKAPAIALRPSLAALKKCLGLLSGIVKAGSYQAEGDDLFAAPDALGWAYQYWNAEEKDRVFEKVRTEKGAKIAGADIIPATQLYTEPYMVKFLVQNSLGALWLGMHPDSDLADGWEYYVRDADRAPVDKKPVRDITFLDPACGSGHFHLEAFDLLYAMYEAEANRQSSIVNRQSPEAICAAILNHNLYGIDIDDRAIQIAQAALWMKAKEVAWELEPEALTGFHHHFVATNIRLPRGKDHLEAFLRQHPEDLPLRPALETVFEGLENAHELGSLLQLEEPVEKELRYLQGKQAEAVQTMHQGNLFAEMAQPRQGALPLGVESYDAWKAKTLAQLRAHFEAEAADLIQSFFGQSVGKGLALFDILARLYDVVVTNPPYMGSSNMNVAFKDYVASHYASGKRDLYAAFILRSYELTTNSGRTALITQQSWMFLRSFVDLRAKPAPKTFKIGQQGFRGILLDTSMEVLGHLGEHGFQDSAAAGAFAAMFVLAKARPAHSHKITAFRLINEKDPISKNKLLLELIAYSENNRDNKVKQNSILRIPEFPIVYWVRERFLEILQANKLVDDVAYVRQGIGCADTNRFVRNHWEVSELTRSRWIPYARGGGYQKWTDLILSVVDWRQNGAAIKESRSIIPSEHLYLKPGFTYTDIARGSMSVRVLPSMHIFSDGGPGIFCKQGECFWLLGLLNSRIITYLLRITCPSPLHFRMGYVANLPVPNSELPQIVPLAKAAASLKSKLCSQNLLEYTFSIEIPEFQEFFAAQSQLLSLEALIDNLCNQAFGLSKADELALYQETGTPTGLLPILVNYDSMSVFADLSDRNRQELYDFTNNREKISLEPEISTQFKQSVRKYFEDGPGSELEYDELSSLEDTEPEDEAQSTGPNLSIPAEFFVEELSSRLGIHPISIFWLLSEGIEQEGWRCPPEEKRLTEDRFTVTILRLLGHRWPKQIEANEPVPAWAEPSGIIPLTASGHSLPTLLDRVRDRLITDFPNGNPASIEREFADIVGEKLVDWLPGSFFTRHISQFKKRPIAWQVQTSPAPGQRQRGGPAFAALLYYHKLSADLLPTLRNQLVRDLTRAYETEQRTLRNSHSLTGDQEARLRQLDIWLAELQAFSDALQFVSDHGFGDTPDQQAALRQFALDDAMQSLKAAWLGRLAAKATSDALPDWQTRADKTGIHPALRDWIATATANLAHQCAQVGAPAPKAAKLKTDPDARALAVIIGTQAKEMVAQSLKLAGDAWFSELDAHVLRPLLDEINSLKAQQAALETERDALAAQDTRALYANEQAIKALKATIRKKNKVRSDYRKTANELREHIESWRCPAAATWTDWLGQQPLFDAFASLDGQRQPPQTIAEFVVQESRYAPDINDGVRVNIAPLQKAGLLAADVLAAKDVDKAIADRAEWRADERRWCREGKLPRPGWWADN